MPSLLAERIESVKAGCVGAAFFVVAETGFNILQNVVNIPALENLNLTPAFLSWEWLLGFAVGAVSGFLFGVTYRYIIRDDRNSHLNEGAVLAFGLVRGLALIETEVVFSQLWLLAIIVIQSIVCFAIARWFLDVAISLKLIKPFIN